jgi:hypothetical protein
MGHLVGPVDFIGKAGHMHAYHGTGSKKSKTLFGKNGGATKEKFNSNPFGQNVRDNAREFGGAGMQAVAFNGKINFVYKEKAGKIYHNLVKIFSSVIKNSLGNKGMRLFSLTLHSQFLKGFVIGRRALESSISSPFTAVLGVGNNQVTVTFPLIPASTVKAPRGATHFRISAGFFVKSDATPNAINYKYTIDSPNGDFDQAVVFNSVWFPVGTDVVAPTVILAGDGVTVLDATETAIGIVGIEFAQEVNTVKNSMTTNFAASIEVVS